MSRRNQRTGTKGNRTQTHGVECALDASDPSITIGITTCNRMDSLRRCVTSLGNISNYVKEIIVVDDTSDEPVERLLFSQIDRRLAERLRIVRQDRHEGYIVARNRIARIATADFVLFLDDDTEIQDAAGVRQAIELLRADPRLVAVAFSQAEIDGRPWPAQMQPAPVVYRCYVPTYIGFAHLMRRSVFLDLGGYREHFEFYGEEKEFCLRALDAGYAVLYLPDVRVAHIPDRRGRDALKYFRYYHRNDCYAALHNYPWPLTCVVIAQRLIAYRRTSRAHVNMDDRAGRWWVINQLLANFVTVVRQRRPVRWMTWFKWRQMANSWPRY